MHSRRSFLATSSLAAAAAAAPAIVRGQNLNSRLQLASIGSGGKGFSDIREMSSHAKQTYVALCDVDLSRTEDAAELYPDAKIYQDFRTMLSEMGDRIDAVTVSTPDHMHAYCAISAMNEGKHVYCQKPLTHNVWEARQLARVARESGIISRMGNQIHSHESYRTAVELIQSGRIGRVKEVHCWASATGHGKSGHLNRPVPEEVPDTLNWDDWIGVAPMRPYHGGRTYAPWGWRDWQDFGGGAVGDFGCHILDPVYTALKITGAATGFRAKHSGMNDEVWPAQSHYDFTVPGTEYTAADTLPISWSDGGMRPSTGGSHIPSDERLPKSGSFLIGEAGTLLIPHYTAPKLFPADASESTDYEMAEDLNHYHGWIDGCLAGKQPSDDFTYGGLITETILLGNIAMRYPKQRLNWNAEAMKITGVEGADKWLTRDYREGWDLKELI